MDVLLTSSGELFLTSLLRKAAVIFDVKETLQKSLGRCPELGTSALKWSGSERLSSLAQYMAAGSFPLCQEYKCLSGCDCGYCISSSVPLQFFCKA